MVWVYSRFTAYSGPLAALLLLCSCMAVGCQQQKVPEADYMVTLPPLKLILEPLLQDRKTVASLLPPGVSPHTYALRPSSARALANAKAVFHVDATLDGWAAAMGGGLVYSLLDYIPVGLQLPYDTDHSHSEDGHGVATAGQDINPHFWSDPQVVAALVPKIVEILIELDPDGRSVYEANREKFLDELGRLDQELATTMATVSPPEVVAFHPSWSYFFKRYGIRVAAYVEPIPGKELTPQAILALRKQLADADRVVILSEVQLSRKSADALAEALSATVCTMDPLGGDALLNTYTKLIQFNATRLRDAFS